MSSETVGCVEDDRESLAQVAVTVDALIALLRAGLHPRLIAPRLSGPHDQSLRRELDALGLTVTVAYRLSDAAKVWLVSQREP